MKKIFFVSLLLLTVCKMNGQLLQPEEERYNIEWQKKVLSTADSMWLALFPMDTIRIHPTDFFSVEGDEGAGLYLDVLTDNSVKLINGSNYISVTADSIMITGVPSRVAETQVIYINSNGKLAKGAIIGGESTTASNGTSLISGVVKLGGSALTAQTVIGGGDQNLYFGDADAGTQLNSFTVFGEVIRLDHATGGVTVPILSYTYNSPSNQFLQFLDVDDINPVIKIGREVAGTFRPGILTDTTLNLIPGPFSSVYISRAATVAAIDTSAIFEINSVTKGVLFPGLTTTQKNAIGAPGDGLTVYDLTLDKLSSYNGTIDVWENYLVNGQALITGGHFEGNNTPTITAGAGAGTSPTISITGTDFSFQISVTPGTTPTGINATIATINFGSAFTGTPRVVFSSANSAAAPLSGLTMVYMDGIDSSHATIVSGATALTTGTTYLWNCTAAR